MDKSAIERFAIGARVKLIQSVSDRIESLGVSAKGDVSPIVAVGDNSVITLPNGMEVSLTNAEAKARLQLIDAIGIRGFDNVVEAVAYTWFNRIIAIRYMEVNYYLPSHIRVLSSLTPEKIEPDLVTQCLTSGLNLTDAESKLINEYRNGGESDKIFNMMVVAQCRELNKILPELFTLTKSYEDLLLKVSFTDRDGVVRDLVDSIPESDFKDAVQIIGWMYQYYNTENNQLVYDGTLSKAKIPKELIPAATQLFTPDWAIRYMVDNSLGRLWCESHPDSQLYSKLKYYLKSDGKTPIELTFAKIRPSDIRVLDPCMGSGHILSYFFDVLLQIYEEYGYTKSEAAVSILVNNIYGIDIDDRAYQLAYFQLMMKGREYNRNIFTDVSRLNLISVSESNDINPKMFDVCYEHDHTAHGSKCLMDCLQIVSLFIDAKDLGSIMEFDGKFDIAQLIEFMRSANIQNSLYRKDFDKMVDVLESYRVLTQQYHVVITNPPYLGSSRFNQHLSDYSKEFYPDSNKDLISIMFSKAIDDMAVKNGFVSFITTSSWMFLSSHNSIRTHIIKDTQIESICDYGTELFDGKVGHNPIASVVLRQCKPYGNVIGIRLVDYCFARRNEKQTEFFNEKNRYTSSQENYSKIPGAPIVYWVSDNFIRAFGNGTPLSEIASPRQGLATGENARFVRMWYEVDIRKEMFDCISRSESVKFGKKWFPYNKGGEYRKWYGNNDCVIDWEDDGDRLRNFKDEKGKLRSVLRNPDYYFQESITWSKISSGSIAFRYKPAGHIFDVAGTSIFADEKNRRYIHGFCNSNVALAIANAISPTLNYEVGHIASFPVIFDEGKKKEIDELVEENIRLSKEEWDSYEVSWDFDADPLIKYGPGDLKNICKSYKQTLVASFATEQRNETQLNRLFISIYGLDSEMSPDVDDSRITIRIPDEHSLVIDLVSYAVGCIFGRYSLDKEGLIFAGGCFDSLNYFSFNADSDNIVPINDDEYFGDDVVTRFVEFLKVAFSQENLDNNIKFVADNLGVKGSGTSKEKIRKYFLNDFYKDHLKMYQKCPIYWLFDSGKENGFKALIYMHRYDENLIGKMRQNYLLPMLGRYRDQAEKESDQVRRSDLQKKIAEVERYDLAMELYSNNKVSIDLDDGVKVNYAKFQNIENSKSAKDRIDLLYRI